MTVALSKPKRPSSITIISVLAIYGGILAFYFVFSSGYERLGLGNSAFYILSGVVFLACGIGFWLMKKWAVYAYVVFGIINQMVLLLIGRWNIMALLIPVIVVYIGYKHLSKMS